MCNGLFGWVFVHICTMELGMGVTECDLSGMGLSEPWRQGLVKPCIREAPGSKET